MKKKINSIVALGILILSLVLDPYILGLCRNNNTYCFFNDLSHSVGKPLFFISLSLVLITLLATFFDDKIYKLWSKFTYAWIPLSLVLIFLIPEYSNTLLPIERDTVSLTMSVLFFIISLAIITFKFLSLRKKSI